MEQIIKGLALNLQEQCELHARLLAQATAINEALRQANVAEVQKCLGQYDDLMEKAETLEEKRLLLCDELARVTANTRRHPNVLQLLEKVPVQLHGDIPTLRDTLKKKVTELANINLSNKIILEQRLSDITGTFDMIAQMTRPKPTGYRRMGAMEQGPSRLSLVNRIA